MSKEIITYYHNNSVYQHYTVNDKDEKHGSYKSYYTNGQLYSELNYVNNQKHGLFKFYYSNGKLWEESTFVNGQRHGQFKSYSPSGQLLEEIYYYKDVEVEKHCFTNPENLNIS